MSTIKAIGFDMDGTFMNTHVDYPKLDNADEVVCEKHGIPFSELEFTTAKRLRHPIREWLESNGRGSEFESISKEIDDLLTSIETEFVDECVPFPGSVEAIDAIKAKGLKIGILSRGSREYVVKALSKHGLLDRFDFVMGRDYSSHDEAKPSPVAMKQFAEELSVSPEEIIYVGDSKSDYYSARDSGATFVGVTTGKVTEEMWHDENPDMVVLGHAGDIVHLL